MVIARVQARPKWWWEHEDIPPPPQLAHMHAAHASLDVASDAASDPVSEQDLKAAEALSSQTLMSQ